MPLAREYRLPSLPRDFVWWRKRWGRRQRRRLGGCIGWGWSASPTISRDQQPRALATCVNDTKEAR